jgi:hypothetical protein
MPEVFLWVMLSVSSLAQGPEVFLTGFHSQAQCEAARSFIRSEYPPFANLLPLPCLPYGPPPTPTGTPV